MADQPKYDPLEASSFFPDGMAARPRVEGTIPYQGWKRDTVLYTGKQAGQPIDGFPMPVTDVFLARGGDRFNIYCSMCHGLAGYGDGMIVQRGYRRPPSFHTDLLRSQKNGYLFDVITNGFGAMPAYGTMIPAEDRWAIVAYVKALQLSQNATLAEVPPAEQAQLTSGGQKK